MTVKKVSLVITVLALAGLAIMQLKPRSTLKTQTITLNGEKILVEIADDPFTRAQGLAGHTSLTDTQGMLFIFSSSDYQSFWMRDMKFPIDIIWLNDEKIVDLAENVPPPEAGEFNLPIYKPEEKANRVLELRAGWVKTHKVKIGDQVVF